MIVFLFVYFLVNEVGVKRAQNEIVVFFSELKRGMGNLHPGMLGLQLQLQGGDRTFPSRRVIFFLHD